MWYLCSHYCTIDVGVFFFFSSRRRHTRWTGDWSSDVCSSDLEAELSRMLAHLLLCHVAKREGNPAEPPRFEVVKHVGLVFDWVQRLVELGATRPVQHPSVVAGRQPVETKLEDAVEHQIETHEGVAAHAGVWGAALQVVAVERLDDPLTELALEVPA